MTNLDIRNAAKAANVHLWQIAEGLGLADTSFSRKLRHELPETEKERIYAIIEDLRKEKA